MASQNGLWFDIGVRNENAIKVLKQLQNDALLTGEKFDQATSSLNTIITALSKIEQVRNQIKSSVFTSKALGIDSSVLRGGLRQLDEFEKRLKNLQISGNPTNNVTALKYMLGAEFSEMLRGLTQAAKEQETVNKLTQKQIELQEKLKNATASKKEENKAANYNKSIQEIQKLFDLRRKLDDLNRKGNALGLDMSKTQNAAVRLDAIIDGVRNGTDKFAEFSSKIFNRRVFGGYYKSGVDAIQNIFKEQSGIVSKVNNTNASYRTLYNTLAQIEQMIEKINAVQASAAKLGLQPNSMLSANLAMYDARRKTIYDALQNGSAADIAKLANSYGDGKMAHINQQATAAIHAQEQANKQAAQATKAHADAQNALISNMQKATEAARQQGRMFSEMKNWAQMYFSFYGAKDFLQSIIKVGGEFEIQHIALQNILGDMQQGTALYNQIKSLSLVSPFTFSQLTNNARQLSAYAIPYEELYDTTKRLSDMASGLGVDFYRLSLAYGQIRSASVLRGQELRQLTEAGIPMVQALSDEFTKLEGHTVTTQDILKKYVPNAKVPFEVVKKVLFEMTDEGGRFYNMQEKLADTLSGKFSNLKDAWEIMLSDMAKGESFSGQILKASIQGLTTITRLLGNISPAVLGAIGALTFRGVARGAGASGASMIMAGHTTFEKTALAAQVSGTRQLSGLEKAILKTKGQIVALEARLLAQSHLISQRDALRLGAQGKLTKAAARRLMLENVITQKQYQQIVNGKKLALYSQLVGGSIKDFFKANWGVMAITAAIGAVGYLYNKNQEHAQKIKEMTDGVTDNAKNLRDIVDGMGDAPKDEMAYNQSINSMLEAIKKSEGESSAAFVKAQTNNIKALADKYEYLAQRIKNANDAASNIRQDEGVLGVMYDAADGGRFENAIGDMADNFNSYTKNLAKAKGEVESWRDVFQKAIKTAINGNAELRQRLQGKPILEQALIVGRLSGGNANPASLPTRVKDAVAEYAVAYDKVETYANKIQQRIQRAIQKGMYYNGVEKLGTEKGKSKLRQEMEATYASIDNLSPELKERLNKQTDMSIEFVSSFAKHGGKAMEEAFFFMKNKIRDGWDFANLTKEQLAEVNKFVNDTISKYQQGGKKIQYNIKNNPILAKIKLIASLEWDTDEMKLTNDAEALWNSIPAADWLANGNRRYKGKEFSKYEFQTKYGTNTKDRQDTLAKAWKDADDNLKSAKDSNNTALVPYWEKQRAYALSRYNEEFSGSPETYLNSKKSKGNKADKELKYWRNRMAQLQKLNDLYKSFESAGTSEGMAIYNVRNSGMSYAKILPENITTKAQLKKWITEQRKKMTETLKGTTEERRTLIDEMLKRMFDVDTETLKENLTNLGERMQRAIKEGSEKWDLYKSIRDKLGDSSLATTLAYAMGESPTKKSDVIHNAIESAIANSHTTGAPKTFEQLLEMYMNGDKAEMKKSGYEHLWSQFENFDNQRRLEEQEDINRVVEALSNTQSEYEKLRGEINKATEQKRLVEKSNLSQERKQQLINAINAQTADKQLRWSTRYAAFFTNFTTLSERQAELIGNKIKENLNDKMKAGVISAKEYADEMTKIDEQLDKIKNQKTDFQALLGGGFSEMYNNRYERYQQQYSQANINLAEASQQYSAALKTGDMQGAQKFSGMISMFTGQQQNALQGMNGAKAGMNGWAIADKIIHAINNGIQATVDAINNINGALDALGKDTRAGTGWGNFVAYANGAAEFSSHATKGWESFKNGDFAGAFFNNVSAFASIWKNAAKLHDGKLDRQINLAEERNKVLGNLKTNLEKHLERTLGGIYRIQLNQYEKENLKKVANDNSYGKETQQQALKALNSNSYYEAELASLMAQRDNIQKQFDSESGKKKKDKNKIEDYSQSVRELDDEIKNFAQDMAKTLYDIDLKSWASQLGDALFEAWKKGENAMDAYKGKLQELIAQTSKNIVTTKILEKAMEQPLNFLTQAMTRNSGKLDEKDLIEFAGKLSDATSNVLPTIMSAYDALEKGLNTKGMTMKDTGSAKSSNVIRGITEEQADILIAYINGMRADLSMHVQDLRQLMERTLPGMANIFEQQLAQLRAIENNTRRNANAAEHINDTLNSIVAGVKSLKMR